MTTVPALGLALVLLAANGFFVAAEFALLTARRSRMEQLAAEGNRAARSALAGIRELSLMLAGAQLGITMCSLGLGIVAEPALAGLIERALGGAALPAGVTHAIAFTVALSVVVFLHMVVGEMAPKSWAISHPEQSALALARPFRAFTRLFRPLILALNALANAVVRAVGVQPQDELAMVHSPDDLVLLLRESREHGLLTGPHHDLLQRGLRLRQLTAGDAMVPRRNLVSVPATASCSDVEEASRRTGRSRLLVTGEGTDDILGAVHVKDTLVLHGAAFERTTAADLARPVLTVIESRKVQDLVGDLRGGDSHIAVVVDEHGATEGMVTLEDALEELIGEFADETDPVAATVTRDGDTVTVPAHWRLDELADRLGIHLPDGDYDTVAGYVLHELGRIPLAGDTVDGPAGRVTVVALDGVRVSRVAIRSPPSGPPD